MGFYKDHKNEIITLQLISQILGKIKVEYAAQEPQWAHVILDMTPRGFTTGLLKYGDSYFEVEVDLINSRILVSTQEKDAEITLENGKTIQSYYQDVMSALKNLGLNLFIQTKPQEMETKTLFEEDTEHHHYQEDVAKQILQWFLFSWDAQMKFIAPIRQRKIYPGLFWGTFDVACILVYNQFDAFPDDTKVIERAAFDEQMIEFGFWLGDDHIENPAFFTLPYPFVEKVELEVDDSFPNGSYFSPNMAEYLYEIKGSIHDADLDEAVAFMNASCKKGLEYLNWKDTDHYFEELKMENNQK